MGRKNFKIEAFPMQEFEEVEKETEFVMREQKIDELLIEERNILEKAGSKLSKKNRSRLMMYLLTGAMAFGFAKEALTQESTTQKLYDKEKKAKIIEKPDMESKLEEERKSSFNRMREVLEKHNTGDKIEYLKNKYGDVISGFLKMRGISNTLEFFKQVEEGLSNNDENIFVNKDFVYASTAGSILSRYGHEYWTNLDKDQKEVISKEITINGFENIPGCTNEMVREILENSYSKSWLKGSTKELNYVPETQTINDSTYKAGQVVAYGISAMIKRDVRAPLTIYASPDGDSVESVIDVIHHELAHSNDWENSMILSAQQRVDMFYDIANRFEDEDRYKSNYVENMISHEDKQMELYIKTSEYWAEISRRFYGMNGDKFKKDFPKDAELVEKWENIISN